MEQKNPLNWLFLLLFLTAAVVVIFLIIAGSDRYKGKIREMMSGPLPQDTRLNNPSFVFELPAPRFKSDISLEETLLNRRSRRSYPDEAISTKELSQLLWAAYGITEPQPGQEKLREGKRTAPSAGAFYPLEVYVVVGKVNGIDPGIYKYVSKGHKIVQVMNGDIRAELSTAAYKQGMIERAPICLFYSAVYERTTRRYGERGRQYVWAELGHSAQNVYLQAETLGMGTCVAGAFNDDEVKKVMQLPPEEVPLYIMPIGKRR